MPGFEAFIIATMPSRVIFTASLMASISQGCLMVRCRLICRVKEQISRNGYLSRSAAAMRNASVSASSQSFL